MNTKQTIKMSATTSLLTMMLAALLSVLMPLNAHAQLRMLDGIIAVVDDDVVLVSELQSRIDNIMQRIEASGQEAPPQQLLYEQVLNRLIDDRLQLNLANRIGVEIPVDEINSAFAKLAAERNLSPERYAELLQNQGFSITGIRDQLEQEIVLSQLQRYQVNRRINITDSEIDNFLKSREGQFWREPDYYIGHIVLNSGSSDIDTVVRELDMGADFRNIAIRYSKGSTALEGGDLGWRKVAQFPNDIADLLAQLDAGQNTRPITSNGAVHVFKVYEKRENERQHMIEQRKVRHILIPTNEIRDDNDALDLATSLVERTQKGEDFSELAKQYSEDYGSALQGGDLGWVLPGQMVPEFEQAAQIAAVNAVTEPIRSQYGWHVILVDEIKDVDMSEDVIRNQAVNLLRGRRYDEELKLWTQELRDDAFIEIINSDSEKDSESLDGTVGR